MDITFLIMHLNTFLYLLPSKFPLLSKTFFFSFTKVTGWVLLRQTRKLSFMCRISLEPLSITLF